MPAHKLVHGTKCAHSTCMALSACMGGRTALRPSCDTEDGIRVEIEQGDASHRCPEL